MPIFPVLEASSRIPQADLRHRRSLWGSGWGTSATPSPPVPGPPPSLTLRPPGRCNSPRVCAGISMETSASLQSPSFHYIPSSLGSVFFLPRLAPWQDLTRDRPSPRAVPTCRPRASIGHAGRQRLTPCGQWRGQNQSRPPGG